MNSTDCISYTSSTLEIFIPSPIVFSTLCVSTDKTNLFIVSLIRLIMYMLIYYGINDMINYDDHRTIQYILVTMICVNILYIGLVVSKNTVFSIGTDQSMFALTKDKNKHVYDTVYDTSSNL